MVSDALAICSQTDNRSRSLHMHVSQLSKLDIEGDSSSAEVGPELLLAILTCLALAVDRTADKGASFVVWHIPGEKVDIGGLADHSFLAH